ncbi:class II aldolase/adducin family protein [Desulfurispira natronophila]|uniref:L-fuculose-phosphate aldolase n=1 Tax=Desulfurispira natronophila TaxID=682562 RepID=A0A7W7Y5B5_9BACT|nr:class II aldolase/adducin family protein [Desulfurispira natronophila]MBB5022378.1 L-fuculose-phosphate aldolase [Desulfurispira natronophila]
MLTLSTELLGSFVAMGRVTYEKDLNSSHSGNMSCRDKAGNLHITRSGAMLGSLEAADVVSFAPGSPPHPRASRELPVHQAVYESNADVGAIVHTHAPHAITLAWSHDKIVPADAEGHHYLPRIPVVECVDPIGSQGLARAVAGALCFSSSVIVRSHGVFSAGSDLEEATLYACCTESICRLLYMRSLYQAGIK